MNVDTITSLTFGKEELFNLNSPFRDCIGDNSKGIIAEVLTRGDNIPDSFKIYLTKNNRRQLVEVFFEDSPIFGPKMTTKKLADLKGLIVKGAKIKLQTIWVGNSAGHLACKHIETLPKSTIL